MSNEYRLISRSIKEYIRVNDAIKSESRYVKSKFKDHFELIDINARNFMAGSILLSMIKYSYGFNHYTMHEKIINYRIINSECPRCSRCED